MDLRASTALIGRPVLDWLVRLHQLATVFATAVRPLLSPSARGAGLARGALLQQILFCGVHALPLIVLLGLSVGVIVTMQGLSLLPELGGENLIGRLLVVVVTRELAPLLTAVVVIARSGTAMTIEIGYMQLRCEIEALQTLGIDPARQVLGPRLAATVASLFGLNVFFNAAAFAAAAAYAALGPADRGVEQTWQNILQSLGPGDLVVGQLKALVFGALIAAVALQQGLRVRGSITELPVRTIRTVVGCFFYCMAANLLITVIAA